MLNQQVALVTGASRGIGAAIAQALGKQGAVVIGTATSASGAEAITAHLKAAGVNGVGLALDVTQPEQIEAVLKQIAEQYGDISILVNNAGITKDTLLMRMKDEDWDAVLNTNLKSVFRMSQAVLRPMKSAPGPHYQYFQRGRPYGQCRASELCCRESRHDRFYQVHGARGW